MSFVVAYLFQLSLCCFYFRTYSLMCNFLFDTYFPLSLKTTSNLTCSILLALCVYSGVSVTLWKPHFLIFVFPQKTVFPWQTGLSDIGLKLLVTYQAKGKIACACISLFLSAVVFDSVVFVVQGHREHSLREFSFNYFVLVVEDWGYVTLKIHCFSN